MIVLDASAALELLLQTAAAQSIAARISGETLHAPHLIDIEVAQTLRRIAATNQTSVRRCETALNDWLALPVTRYPHSALLPRVWMLRANIAAYDAIYVALAEALAAPLITHDGKLANAPGHNATIELL